MNEVSWETISSCSFNGQIGETDITFAWCGLIINGHAIHTDFFPSWMKSQWKSKMDMKALGNILAGTMALGLGSTANPPSLIDNGHFADVIPISSIDFNGWWSIERIFNMIHTGCSPNTTQIVAFQYLQIHI